MNTSNVKNIKKLLAGLAAALFLIGSSSCSDPKFKVEGTVNGADNKTIVIECANASGMWLPLDSARTDADGHFSLRLPAPEQPELYRLSYGGSYIYLPVDSIETLTLTTTAKQFGSDFTLVGTDQANLMTQFQKRLGCLNLNNPDSVALFKRWVLSNVVLAAQGHPTVLQYYALTCNVGGKQLFNINTPEDARAFSAVATAYQQYRPDDPRAKALEQLALRAQRSRNSAQGRVRKVQAGESAMIDMELKDKTGRPQKLSTIASNGKPTLVIFTSMGQENSAVVTGELGKVYGTYGNSMNFYMVCLNTNIAAWREEVRDIPWTTVIDPDGQGSLNARNYALQGLPTFFLYNSKGELVDRANNFPELLKKLPSVQ